MPEVIDTYLVYGNYSRIKPCDTFGWCPPADDPRPTQMWYPISHGTECVGHRQYVLWDSLVINHPVSWRGPGSNYWIRLSDKWKDAL